MGSSGFLWRRTSGDCWNTTRRAQASGSLPPPVPWRSTPMPSLKERIDLLEADLTAVPPRISVYHDLPFAILQYDPADEWKLRREVKLLATRLAESGKQVHTVSLAELLWEA